MNVLILFYYFIHKRIFRIFLSGHLAYPVVAVNRWGATDDLANSSLHSSCLSAFFDCGQEVFVGSNGLPSCVSDLFVGDVISVCDAEELFMYSLF